jgi:hypothetical protein
MEEMEPEDVVRTILTTVHSRKHQLGTAKPELPHTWRK